MLDPYQAHLDDCAERCRAASSSFYASFSCLPTKKRYAVMSVYALCRWLDDIVDGDSEERLSVDSESAANERLTELMSKKSSQPVASDYLIKLQSLTSIREAIDDIFETGSTDINHPVIKAIEWTVSQFPIKKVDLFTIIDGMEDDLFEIRLKSYDDVRAYAFKVASSVGLVLLEIYGYSSQSARLHAIDLGIQLQMINILRDVREDYDRDRIYLPIESLNKHNVSLSKLNDDMLVESKNWTEFMDEYLGVVDTHMESASHLNKYLDADVRVHVKILTSVYTEIFRGMVKSKNPLSPVGLSTWKKFSIASMILYSKFKNRVGY